MSTTQADIQTSPKGKDTLKKEEEAKAIAAETDAAPETTNFDVKHPLQNRWVIYYDSRRTKTTNAGGWGDNIKRIFSFDTVEDFWCLFNNIVPPSKLDHQSNYWLFKEGIEPKWEDAANAHGGSWKVEVSKDNASDLDNLWMLTALSLIGENLDDGTEICGAVVSCRNRGDKISVWTRSADAEETQMNIGYRIKASLETSLRLEYGAHIEPPSKSKKGRCVAFLCIFYSFFKIQG